MLASLVMVAGCNDDAVQAEASGSESDTSGAGDGDGDMTGDGDGDMTGDGDGDTGDGDGDTGDGDGDTGDGDGDTGDGDGDTGDGDGDTGDGDGDTGDGDGDTGDGDGDTGDGDGDTGDGDGDTTGDGDGDTGDGDGDTGDGDGDTGDGDGDTTGDGDGDTGDGDGDTTGDGDGDTTGDGDGDTGDGDGDTTGDGDGDTTGDGDGDTTGDGDGDTGDGDGDTGETDEICPNHIIAGELPLVLMGSNVDATDDYDPTCKDFTGGKDVTLTWTVPQTGTYQIDTNGSSYDTLVTVQAGMCMDAGQIIACDDDGGESTQSLVLVDLFEGEEVTIIIDAWNANSTGDWVLNITPFVCPFIMDLGEELPIEEFGAVEGGAGEISGTCGGNGKEAAYTWTAPEGGLYIFDTFGSNYDTVLYLREASCGGDQIACNDQGGIGNQSRVEAVLEAGETVYVVVDNYSAFNEGGDYTLNINQFQCPLADNLGAMLPVMAQGSVDVGPGDIAGSCGGNGQEAAYLWTAPHDGVFVIDTYGSDYDTVLHVREGDTCEGQELACKDSGGQEEILIELVAGQTIYVVVDKYSTANAGDYVLNIDEFQCPDAVELVGELPLQEQGSVTSGSGEIKGSCGGNGNEGVYLFTAPEVGSYTFTTAGSNYDTVLYIHDGDCLGVELECDDSFDDGGEEITLNLATGQTVYVVVDNYYTSDEGDYVLNVTQNL
ncbi:MAG: hypothetical protein R6X02_23660 [Enhygromyxa sp.]